MREVLGGVAFLLAGLAALGVLSTLLDTINGETDAASGVLTMALRLAFAGALFAIGYNAFNPEDEGEGEANSEG